MKQKLLLVSALMLTMSVNALADEVWPVPTVATQALVLDGETEQYIFNVETKAFMLGANDYKTRSSVSTEMGYKWKITSTGEGTYSLTDFVESQNAWKKMFVENNASIWVDNNSGPNCDSWTITANEDGTAIIGNQSFPNEKLGVAKDLSNTRNYLSSYFEAATPAIEAAYTWTGVSVEAYATFQAYAPRYFAAVALKEAIDAAHAKYADLDLADELAVYNNAESTLEQLQAAKEAVATKLVARDIAEAEANATATNPIDLTSKIVNPTFDVIGDFTGWKGSSFGAGGATSTCAERYQMTFDTWQNIEGLPNGVYMVNVDGFYRAGGVAESYANFKNDTEKNAKLYATSDSLNFFESEIMNIFNGVQADEDPGLGGTTHVDAEANVTYYLPNSMVDFVAFNNAGYYKTNRVMVAVVEGKLHLGVKKATQLAADWVIVDNFGLTYYGQGADAYQLLMDGIVANVPLFPEGTMMTAGMLNAYFATIVDHKTAATYAEVLANKAAIEEAVAAIEENIAAWAELYAKFQEANTMANNGDLTGDYIDALADYLDEIDSDGVFTALTLTTAEVKEMTQTLVTMMNDATENDLKPGSLFDKMTNPSFSDGNFNGWKVEAASGGNVVVNASAKCAEAWNNANFNIYQVIEGAPVGIYSISMQGFYREWRGNDAWNLYYDEDGVERDTKPQSTAFVYMNDMKTPLANVFEYQVPQGELYSTQTYADPLGTYWYPDGMISAGEAFGQGAYKVAAYGIVAKKGDVMKVGVKGSSNAHGDSWAIFDNFELRFEGKNNATINKQLLEAEVAKFNGTALIGSDVQQAIVAALAAANEALAGSDARQMFDALAVLCALEEKYEASEQLFIELNEANTALGVEIEAYNATARPAAVTEAMALYNEVDAALKAKTYTDAQATEALAKIKAASSALKIPADVETATDESPVDMTALIATPTFDKDGVNSAEGWEGTTGLNFGNDATQKGALAVEFYEKTYDMYQEIGSLPAGTYELKVSGFFRHGSIEEDYAHYLANEYGLVRVYATTSTGSYAIGMRHLVNDEDAMPEKIGSGAENEVTASDGSVFYVPNDMVSASAYFQEGKYLNSLIFTVGEEGNLRFGVKQRTSVTSGWMIMDDWKLTYYGTNSNKETGITEIENVKSSAVEFFNLAGQRVNGVQNGITVARFQMTDGSVKTVKIVTK